LKEQIMSAQAALVLNDGQATPVAHTFAPKGAKKNQNGLDIATWRDQSPANAEVYLSLVEQHSEPNGNRVEKFRYVITVPTPETVGTNDAGVVPPVTKAYDTIGVVEVWATTRATQQELKDIVAYVKNFTATTYFSDAITKREAAW
jgi:hypothetical protein